MDQHIIICITCTCILDDGDDDGEEEGDETGECGHREGEVVTTDDNVDDGDVGAERGECEQREREVVMAVESTVMTSKKRRATS